MEVDNNCLTWDRKHLECTQCRPTTYLVAGRCCSEGQYSSAELDTCENIAAINNCSRYNVVDGCTKCGDGFILDRGKSTV